MPKAEHDPKHDPLNYVSNGHIYQILSLLFIVVFVFFSIVVIVFFSIVVVVFSSRRVQHPPSLSCFIITAVSAGKIRKASWCWAEEGTVFHSELI